MSEPNNSATPVRECPDEPFTCQLCFVFDEAAAVAEVKHWKDHAEEAGAGFAQVCRDYARVSARNVALIDSITALADSIHGDSGGEHNSGCEGEPDCFACIEADLRRLAGHVIRPVGGDSDG